MQPRFRFWQLILVLALLVGGAVGYWYWHNQRVWDASGLMQSLPVNGAVKLYVDIAKLRAGGALDLIAGKKAVEDPEYRAFAEQIGLDYRTDLDAIAVSFVNGGVYAAARGRFNWKKLDDYARSQQGRCVGQVCTMPASQPNKNTSFYPLNDHVLAIAVSDAPEGVRMIAAGQSKGLSVPPAFVWISAPGPSFQNPPALIPGTRSFLTPLADSQEASFGVQPRDFGKSDELEIRMDVLSKSADAATQLAGNLTSVTLELRHMLSLDKLTPPKSSLTSLLVSGHFEAHESRVTGTWPLDLEVIQALASGKVN